MWISWQNILLQTEEKNPAYWVAYLYISGAYLLVKMEHM